MEAEGFWRICGGISFCVWGYITKNALIANIHSGFRIFTLNCILGRVRMCAKDSNLRQLRGTGIGTAKVMARAVRGEEQWRYVAHFWSMSRCQLKVPERRLG